VPHYIHISIEQFMTYILALNISFPQVTLHRFDEGLVISKPKLPHGAVFTCLARAASAHGMDKTAACRVIGDFVVRMAKTTAPNKNVELNGRDGLKSFTTAPPTRHTKFGG
jgi:hypothetical protein